MKKYCYFCACVFATLLSIGFSTSAFADDVPAEGKTVTTAGGTTYNGTATTEPYGTLWFNLASGGTQSGALTGNMNLKVQFGDAFNNGNRFTISSTNNTFIGSIEVNTGTLRVDNPSSLGSNKNITFTDGSLMTTSTGFDSSYTFTITEEKLGGLRATGGATLPIGAKITGAGSLEIINDFPVTLTNTANDYQGATYIGKNGWRSDGLANGATLMLGNSEVLPDTTVINMGGGTVTGIITLDLNGVDETVAGLIGTSANITNTKAAAAASLTLNTASEQSYDYKGSITGKSATALTTINVIGAGTQILSSATITNTNLSVGDTATLKLKNVQTLPNLRVGAEATLSAADNSTPMTLTLTGADASSIEGTLSASATSINYNGTGTLTLSNANLKTGATTITSGTLNLSDQNVFSGGLTASNCVVNVSGDSVLDSGSVVSGPLGTGALNLSNLTLNLTKVSYDANYLAINGGATFGEATIIDVSNYLPSANISEMGEITVFSAGSITGVPVFQNAPAGWIYSVDGAKIVLNYTEDTIWTWTGLSNTSFNNAENWDKGTAPVSGSDVKIHSDTTNTANVDSDASVKTVALDAASNLQFEAGKTLTTQSMTIGGENPTLDLTGGNLTLITAPAFNITNSDSDSANTSTLTLSSGTYSNVLSGNTNLTKIGPGELTLSGENTYTGATTISGGTLALTVDDAIASSASVTNNATITFANTSQTLNGLTGTGTIAGSGALTLVNDTDSLYSGTITGSTRVTKTGTGTLTLSGENTFTGGTTISAGTLHTGVVNALGTGTVTINQDGTLNWNVASNLANTISGTGTLKISQNRGGNYDYGLSSKLQNFTGTIELCAPDTGDRIRIEWKGGTNAEFNKVKLVKITSGNEFWVSTNSATINCDWEIAGTGAGAGGDGSPRGVFRIERNTVFNGNVSLSANATIKARGANVVSTFSGDIDLKAHNLTFQSDNLINSTVITGNILSTGGTGSLINGTGTSSTTMTLKIGDTTAAGSATTQTVDVNIQQNNTISPLIFQPGENRNIAVSGIISGAGAFTKTGAGTLTLSGENTYTGATTISGGQIIATNASALGSGAVTNNSELEFNLASDGTCSNVISGSGQLYKTGIGTLTTNKKGWSYTGGITVSEGVMKFGVHDTFGNVDASPSVTINVNGGTLASNNTFTTLMNVNLAGGTINSDGGANATYGAFQIKGAITVSGDKPSYITQVTGKANNGLHIFNNTFNVADVADGDDLIVSATLRNAPNGAAKGFTKTGAGTLTLSGENTYSGATTISEGRIKATNDSALGTGTVTNNSELEFNLASNGTYSKVISGSGALYKSGDGTLTLSGANEFTGGMTISEGKVSVATGSTSLGDGALTLNSGATLIITGGDSNKTLAITGAATLNGTLDLSSYLTTWETGSTYTLMTANSIGSTEGLSLSGVGTGWGWEQLDNSILLKYSSGTLGWKWTGTTGSFMTAANWENNEVPVATSDVTITKADGVAQIDENATVKTVTLGKASNLQFTAGNTLTAETMTMGGTDALNLTGGSLALTNAPAFNINNSDTGNASTLTLSTGTYANVLSGNTNLTKTGDGTLTLSGTNTYTGTTTISGGTLKLSGSGVINVNSVINIAENGTLELASTAYSQTTPFANTITGAGTILQVANSAGMKSDISGFTGTFKIQKDVYFTGNIDGSKSEWIVSDGATLKTVSGNTIQIKSITTDSGTYLARNWMDATDPNATYKIGSGIISGTIGYTAGTNETQKQRMSMVALEKVSDGTTSGGTLTLSGENTYTGGTTISGGTLVITNAEALGTGEITLNGGTLSTSGTIDLDENVVINANSTIDTANGLTLSGNISGTAALTKTGAGTLTLSGSDGTYSGTTTVSAGKLSITNSSAISDSAKIIIESGAEIESNAIQTIHNLNGSGTYTAGGDLTINSTLSDNIFNGTIAATGNNVIFTGDGKQKMSFGPSPTDGSLTATLVKLQSGRLDIKGLMNAGLEITGGVFSPGNSVGSLTANSFTLNGGTALFEFDKTIGSDGAWDTLTIVDSGNITLTSGVFDLLFDDANYWHKVGEEYQLIAGTTGYATDTDLTNWLASAYQSTWSLTGKTDGIYLSANDTPEPSVPEPSTWALLILGALGMMYFRRKK